MSHASDGVAPLIALDRRSSRPLHQQISERLRAAIAGGELAAGQRLPSSRDLAAGLGVSRMPVLTAYAQLAGEGYLEGRAGAGSFVRRGLAAAPPQPPPAGRRTVARRVARTPEYQRLPRHRGWGSFGVHQPALDHFPYRVWSGLIHRHSRNPSVRALRGLDPQGSERCREAVCAYLRTARAVACDPDQIMMVSGSQQALDLCVRVLCDPGARVWMEEPGYWLARHAFQAAGCRVVPVAVDGEGLDVDAGRRRAPRARLAYVTPSHQYPLGATMSARRRLALLAWAQSAGAWILEDDYDGEYRFEAQPVVSLQGLDRSARVIYIGTLSKVMFPSLRLGYLVLPRDLVPAFLAVRFVSDIAPPHLAQAALADFMAEGHFGRHIQRMRRLYRERRSALVRSLGGELPEWQVWGAESGMHLAVTSPAPCDDTGLAARAADQGLWLWPLSPAYTGRAKRTGFILGYGSTAPAAIPAAVQWMRRVVEGRLAGKP